MLSAESRPPRSALTLVAILFSPNYIISKLAMNAFAPLVFAYLRVAGSALVLNLLPAWRTAASAVPDRRGRLSSTLSS